MDCNILVADDEKELADVLALYLTNDGYTVHKCYTGAEALDCIAHTELDLAILDVMFPDADAFKSARKSGKGPITPLLCLQPERRTRIKSWALPSARTTILQSRLTRWEVVRPRKTQLRRYRLYNGSAPKPEKAAREYDIRGLSINRDNHKCFLFGREVQLTPIEFSILWYLCERQGVVVPSEELFEAVWGEKYLKNNNTVMAHIGRLREKLDEPARNPRFVKTVWGVGYTIET